MFLSEFIISLNIFLYQHKKTKKNTNKKKPLLTNSTIEIELINIENKLHRQDNYCTIIIFIIFASYFDFIGSINRRYLMKKIYNLSNDNIDYKVRSLEICIASLLCYYTLGINIYKHHKISLIIITICLFIIFTTEIIICILKQKSLEILFFFGLMLLSAICRAFLETTEKYLFEYNYLDPYKLLFEEEFLNSIFFSIFYSFKKPRNELSQLAKKLKDDNYDFYIIGFLLLLYFILSGLKRIYRINTVRLFTPMTRALAESILDPLIIIFNLIIENGFIIYDEKGPNYIYFGIILFCSIIMIICSCIYNEVFFLYCLGMEHDTYLEITNRAKYVELPKLDNKNNNNTEKNNENDNDNDTEKDNERERKL